MAGHAKTMPLKRSDCAENSAHGLNINRIMSDITMCTNTQCPLKELCKRFNSKPNEFWQSYLHFDYRIPEGTGVPICDHYLYK
jgi:hypothetical protein